MLVLRTSRLRRTIVMTSIAGGVGALTWLHGIATAATAVVTPASMSSAESRVLSARIGELERRIVDLEALRAAAPAPVRAPFVVVDADGAVLMRVDRSAKTGFPRVTVGDTSGRQPFWFRTKEGGAVQLIDATNKVRLTALASPTRTGVTTFLRAVQGVHGRQRRRPSDVSGAESRRDTGRRAQGPHRAGRSARDHERGRGPARRRWRRDKRRRRHQDGPGWEWAGRGHGKHRAAASEIQGKKK
jgi:hypothetical protein